MYFTWKRSDGAPIGAGAIKGANTVSYNLHSERSKAVAVVLFDVCIALLCQATEPFLVPYGLITVILFVM